LEVYTPLLVRGGPGGRGGSAAHARTGHNRTPTELTQYPNTYRTARVHRHRRTATPTHRPAPGRCACLSAVCGTTQTRGCRAMPTQLRESLALHSVKKSTPAATKIERTNSQQGPSQLITATRTSKDGPARRPISDIIEARRFAREHTRQNNRGRRSNPHGRNRICRPHRQTTSRRRPQEPCLRLRHHYATPRRPRTYLDTNRLLYHGAALNVPPGSSPCHSVPVHVPPLPHRPMPQRRDHHFIDCRRV